MARRPMIEMTGTVADLREQDYVDEIGGGTFKRYRVGALIHQLQKDATGIRFGRSRVTIRRGQVGVDFLAIGTFALAPECPVKFRRFADLIAA